MLQNLFAAVAPGSLWPVDVLLRVLFCDVDQASVVNEMNCAPSLEQSVCFQVKQFSFPQSLGVCTIMKEMAGRICQPEPDQPAGSDSRIRKSDRSAGSDSKQMYRVSSTESVRLRSLRNCSRAG